MATVEVEEVRFRGILSKRFVAIADGCGFARFFDTGYDDRGGYSGGGGGYGSRGGECWLCDLGVGFIFFF